MAISVPTPAISVPTPAISVVIPAYNAERFLPRCLSSVFAQTLPPREVFIADDGSTDDTARIAAQLGATVLRGPNRGPSAARNAGLRAASSPWVALLDADDLWAPDKLARQASLLQPDTSLVYTGIRVFDDTGVRNLPSSIPPATARTRLRFLNTITPSSVLLRRDLALQDGGFREDIRTCEDWEMWVRLARLGSFQSDHAPLTDYFVYPNSLSANPEKMLAALDPILDTLTSDLHGFDRWAWRRRIRAVQLRSAGLIARDNGLPSELRYMLQSLAVWPSPFWDRPRFALAAVTAKQRLLRPSAS
jgi:glycosyltransferase involved in cell wall biosynthesis